MITTMFKTNAKKFLMALGVVVIGLFGAGAMAGEVAGGAAGDGKSYQDYTEQETEEMIDAIDRDNPVSSTGTEGGNYTKYDGDNATEMVDAIDRGNPVTATGGAMANPLVKIDGDNDVELVDEIDREEAAGK